MQKVYYFIRLVSQHKYHSSWSKKETLHFLNRLNQNNNMMFDWSENEKLEERSQDEQPQRGNSWIFYLIKKFAPKRSKQMILPDDKNPTIVWDPVFNPPPRVTENKKLYLPMITVTDPNNMSTNKLSYLNVPPASASPPAMPMDAVLPQIVAQQQLMIQLHQSMLLLQLRFLYNLLKIQYVWEP